MESLKDNRTLPKLLGLVIGAALFAMPVSPLHAEAFPSVVCGARNNLQHRIDAAPDGATIFFGDGTCEGPYIISGKDVNLRGFVSADATLSAPPGSFCVLFIEAARVKITRADIDADGADNGICVSTGGTAQISEGTTIRNAGGAGIFLFNGGSALIRGGPDVENIIEYNGAGIKLDSGAHALIEHSQINNNNEDGIIVQFSSSAVLANLTITGNETGVLVDTNSSVGLFSDPDESFIQGNTTSGVVCGFSGVLEIGDQNFGTGNGTGAADNVVVDPACDLIGDASPP